MLHSTPHHPYRRLLIKLSGEILIDPQSFGINFETCKKVAINLQMLQKSSFEIAIVIGGGNIFRGIKLESSGMARTPADQIGMLATLINGIALQQSLEDIGCACKLLTAIECPKIAESYTWHNALDH